MAEILKEKGLSIKDACTGVGLSRSSYYANKIPKLDRKIPIDFNDAAIVDKIKGIKTEHPFWGYRRVSAWLRYREQIQINRKRMYRIMKEYGLLVDGKRYKAKRSPQRSKPRAERPLAFWGIDMTKFLISGIGWVCLIIVMDWYTKKIVGRNIALRCKSTEWKKSIDMAVNNEFPEGVRGKGLKLISDNGSQPTSTSFMKDMAILDIEQVFTSYNNPKGNADTERMMRTIKEEVIWLNEFTSIEEASDKIYSWIDNDYNKFYVHSTLGYLSPIEFESFFYKNNLKVAMGAK